MADEATWYWLRGHEARDCFGYTLLQLQDGPRLQGAFLACKNQSWAAPACTTREPGLAPVQVCMT